MLLLLFCVFRTNGVRDSVYGRACAVFRVGFLMIIHASGYVGVCELVEFFDSLSLGARGIRHCVSFFACST